MHIKKRFYWKSSKRVAPILAVLLLAAALAMAMGLAACGGGGGDNSGGAGTEDTLGGTPKEITDMLFEAANASLAEADRFPDNYSDEALTADNATMVVGLSPEDFSEHVTEGVVRQALINVVASEIALLKCKDAKSAATVKSLISQSYESGKWICVLPEECYVTDSGSYVLLYAGTKAQGDAMLAGLKDAAQGNVGAEDVFFVSDRAQGGDIEIAPGDGIETAPDDGGGIVDVDGLEAA